MKTWSFLGVVATVLGMATFGVGCAAGAAEDADSSTSDLAQQKTILALGDSIAFAWDPTAPKVNGKVIASNYRGYADILGTRLGLAVENSACPGEASGSFLDAKADDNGCRQNRSEYRMHSDWGNAQTQMEYAIGSLQKSIAAGNPPELITLSIGGNDLLLVQKACKGWGPVAAGCQVAKLPFAEHAYGEHLEKIIKMIDDIGYRGTMAIVTTHAPDYSDAVANFALGRFNDEIRQSVDNVSKHLNMRVVVADGFGAFKVEADKHGGKTCETGLLVKNPDGKTCDIHPSLAGHEILANAIQKAVAE